MREADAERAHTLLAEAGGIFMKMEKNILRQSRRHAARPVRGTSWMLLHQAAL
jgi:hypothetical protein